MQITLNYKKIILTLITFFSFNTFAKKEVRNYDRDGDNYSEEKITEYKKGIYTLKIIVEVDTNKDRKYDREITTYFHHDRLKTYEITRVDSNYDGKWDKKRVKIDPLRSTH